MISKIEGISAGTVLSVARAIFENDSSAESAIAALLASGEVVLRKDVEELVDAASMAHFHAGPDVFDNIKIAIAKFTTPTEEQS